jgi:hypothetical protein
MLEPGRRCIRPGSVPRRSEPKDRSPPGNSSRPQILAVASPGIDRAAIKSIESRIGKWPGLYCTMIIDFLHDPMQD